MVSTMVWVNIITVQPQHVNVLLPIIDKCCAILNSMTYGI